MESKEQSTEVIELLKSPAKTPQEKYEQLFNFFKETSEDPYNEIRLCIGFIFKTAFPMVNGMPLEYDLQFWMGVIDAHLNSEKLSLNP